MKIEDYLKLPYNINIQKINDESGEYYYARVIELDGCQSDGETVEEAYKNILDAMEGYIETKLANNQEIPLPNNSEQYSGKFVVRIPKSLHKSLAIAAQREGVSLNQYALYKLSL
ncbi:MAG: type II toxin-antitoxin system HicB family antitoxin [Alphaproteobacteria bacterium]|nr:type II toxin-antitoxin system HicB family antitoxin [Alphaproteobacteria bacterium]